MYWTKSLVVLDKVTPAVRPIGLWKFDHLPVNYPNWENCDRFYFLIWQEGEGPTGLNQIKVPRIYEIFFAYLLGTKVISNHERRPPYP